MKLAALGNTTMPASSSGVQRFLVRASLRRGFHFTEAELDRLSPRQVRRYQAYLQGLDEAASERSKKQQR